MKRFLSRLRKTSQALINIFIRGLLYIVYFTLLAPFGICIRLSKDYLGLKSAPRWEKHRDISDIRQFLKKQ